MKAKNYRMILWIKITVSAALFFLLPGFVFADTISVSPDKLNFGAVGVGQSKDLTVTVNVTTLTLVTVNPILAPPCNCPEFSIVGGDIFARSVGGVGTSGSTTFDVRFTPSGVGKFTGTITIAGGIPVINLPVGGLGVDIFKVSPTSWDFGDVPVGSTATKIFNIRYQSSVGTANITSLGGLSAPFSVTSILKKDSGGTTSTVTTPFSLGPGESASVVVGFTPTSIGGPVSQTLSINHNASSPGSPVNVSLSGSGIPPVIHMEVSPNPVNFDDVVAGRSPKQVFTIINRSNSTGKLTGTLGSFSSPFSGPGNVTFELAPGESQPVVVGFSPTSSGSFTQTLSITHNATSVTNCTAVSSTSCTVTLNGTGVPLVVLAVNPSPLSFGNIPVGGLSRQIIVLTNLSASPDIITGTIDTSSLASPFSVSSGGGSFSLAPRQSMRVVIDFSPTTLGPFSDTLTLTHNATNVTGCTAVTATSCTVTVNGTGASPVINMRVSPDPLEFSNVVVGRSLVLPLTLTNLPTSTAPLTGTVGNPASPFSVVIGAGPFSLGPGKSLRIGVRFAPTSVGALLGTLPITHNATNQSSPTNVQLTGTGAPAINLSVSPVPVNFGKVPTGQSVDQVLTISNSPTSSTVLTGNVGFPSSPFFLTAGGGAFSLGPGQSKGVVIRFSPTTTGSFSGTLTLTHNATNVTSPVNVALGGEGVPPGINLEVSPNPVEFSNVLVGRSSSQILTIRNLSTSTVTLDGSVNGNGLSSPFSIARGNGPFSLAPGESQPVVVNFSPTSPGSFTQTLSLTHNATTVTNCTVVSATNCTVTLKGVGAPATNLAISPVPVDFGTVPVDASLLEPGRAPTQTLTITNLPTSTGTLDGNVDTSGLPSPFSVISGGGTFSLPPGTSRAILISFAPTSAASFLGTLSITHNATNRSSPVVVPVSGIGTVPGINFQVRPNPIDFGSLSVNQSANQTLTITNLPTSTGTLDVTVGSPSDPFSIVKGGGTFSLAPGNSQDIVVGFSPTSPGLFSGLSNPLYRVPLSIAHSATNQNFSVTVPLIGTGVSVVNLSISPPLLDFGKVPTGQAATQILSITNLASSTVTLDGEVITSSLTDPFSVASGGSVFTLAPGQSRSVLVRFSPTSTGTFSDTLFITHNATNQGSPTAMSLTGTGVTPVNLAIDPAPVRFGAVTLGQAPTQTIKITNESTSAGTLEGSVGSLLDPFSVVSGGGTFSIPPGESQSIVVRFSPAFPGTFSDLLFITHNATNQSNPTSIPVTGTGASALIDMTVGPDPADFSNVLVGQPTTLTLTVTNRSISTGTLEGSIGNLSRPFSVVSGGGDFSLAPGKSRSVVISFLPTSAGLFSDTLSITHNATNQNSPTAVLVTGTGTSVVGLSISPSPVSFGNVTVGQSSKQTITITNPATSNGTLEGSIGGFSGPFSLTSGDKLFSLPPGKSESLGITFSPTSPGTFFQTLSITHNATNQSSPFSLVLGGIGVAPVINMEISPNPVDFSGVNVAQASSQGFTITNLPTSTGTLKGSVDAASLSEPFSVVEGDGSFSLEPGKSKSIVLSFSPTSSGTFSQPLSIPHNATNQGSPAKVTLSGTGVSVLNLSVGPTPVNFGDVAVGQLSRQTLTILNLPSSTEALQGSVGTLSSPFSIISGEGPFSLAPGQSRSVVIGFSPTSKGVFSQTISITHNAKNLSSPVEFSVTGTGILSLHLSLSSTSVGFSTVPVGQSATRTLTITNDATSTSPLTGVVGSLSSPFSVIDGEGTFTLNPGKSRSIIVSFSPTSTGIFVGALSITHNGENLSSPITVLFSGATPISWGVRKDIPIPRDYDGDQRADIAIWRPGEGTWYILPSTTSPMPFVQPWGVRGDKPVPADYDGDGLADLAVFRPATRTWFILNSLAGPRLENFGNPSDIPVPGDYDGDGKTDLGVFRPGQGIWFISLSGGGSLAVSWGLLGDIPVPGDYDGDGKTDLGVWRPSDGKWYLLFSDGNSQVTEWGLFGDTPVPADYDGDGKADLGIWRPIEGNWYLLFSGGGFALTQQGASGDIPVPADYNGDGRADLALWRPSDGTWLITFGE